jgi:hypothetical protein
MRSKPNLVSLCGIADDAIEVDLSGLGLDGDDAVILASELPDKGAISSMNLLKNAIPAEQAYELVKIMQSKEKLITLCGLSGNEATLDFSNQALGPKDAVRIANDISDMGALVKFDISDSTIGAEGSKAIAEALKGNQTTTELNISKTYPLWDGKAHQGMSGIIAIANTIKDMGALLLLDISSNGLWENWTFDSGSLASGQWYVNGKHPPGYPNGGCKEKPEETNQGVFALCNAIKDMRALSTFTFSGDYSSSQPIAMETTMTEADFSGKELGVSGGMMVAAFLPKCQ